MRAFGIVIMGVVIALSPAAASAQSLFEGLARSAARAVAGQAVNQVLSGASATPAPAPAATQEQAAGQAREVGRRRGPATPPPPETDMTGVITPQDRAALEALEEMAREDACRQRNPLPADGGYSSEQASGFRICMGPRWGEGA